MGSESLVVYVNGEYVPREQARISVFDVGFLRGDAVFDTTSAWNGRIFKLHATWSGSSCPCGRPASSARYRRRPWPTSSSRRRAAAGYATPTSRRS
jgi:hypothetical protein